MLPSGNATLEKYCRAVHPELALLSVHTCVKFSSPKNHAQPVGLPVEASVNITCNGTGPEVGVPLNAATWAADTPEIQRQRRNTPTITQIKLCDFISDISK
jgi:hypothetical protein